MTLSYFNQLTEGKKAYFLDNFCTHLGSYAEDLKYLVSLYYATDFFIEVKHNFSDDSIDSITAFRSTHRIESFLVQIKLVGLEK